MTAIDKTVIELTLAQNSKDTATIKLDNATKMADTKTIQEKIDFLIGKPEPNKDVEEIAVEGAEEKSKDQHNNSSKKRSA